MFELETILILIAIVVVVVIGAIAFLAGSYTVVPPYEAHVVVSRQKGRQVYCAREGYKSSYWKVPIIQQRAIIPIENIQLNIEDIPLRDKEMAKFLGDVVAWLNIIDPLLAAERIGRLERGVESIISDIRNVIQAVTRNMSMKWTVIDIIKTRKEFSDEVEKAVNEELSAWGMKLVELEVIHFDDIKEPEPYTVIKDLEERQATVINSETRKIVAGQKKEASIVETTAEQLAEVKKAENEEIYKTRQIEKDETLGMRAQEKDMKIAEQMQKANQKMVEAEKASVVGKAQYEKEATITKAEGEATANLKRGEATAKVTQITGTAEGEVIRAKGFAEADATDKRAEALKKYNEAGIGLEVINASKTVQIEQANAWARAMSAAKIQVYSGGEAGKLFGLPLTPQGAFSLGAFAEIAKEHGVNVQEIAESVAKGTILHTDIGKAAAKQEKLQKTEEGKKNVKD